jgi:hypothetical protein
MAKKEKKGKKERDEAAHEDAGRTGGPSSPLEALDAVRSAIERTLSGAGGSAQATRERAGGLASDLAGAALRVREMIDDLRLQEEIRGLRREVELLASRVAALEARPTAAKETAGGPQGDPVAAAAAVAEAAAAEGAAPARRAAARKPATPRKPAAARKPAAGKPAAPATSPRRPATRRVRPAASPDAATGAGSAGEVAPPPQGGEGIPPAAV